MERFQEQMGYLVLTMDGAVISSGGDLQNNEEVADIIAKSIVTSKNVYMADGQFENLLIIFQNYHYSICVSNKKIHVYKVKHDPNTVENDDIRVITDSL